MVRDVGLREKVLAAYAFVHRQQGVELPGALHGQGPRGRELQAVHLVARSRKGLLGNLHFQTGLPGLQDVGRFGQTHAHTQ